MQPPKKFWTLWKVIGGIFVLALLWIVFEIVSPVGGAIVQIESTRSSLNHIETGGYLNVNAPSKPGKIVHINFVDMPEPGFVVIYHPDWYTKDGPQSYKFYGATRLLPKGKSENIDIALSEEVRCAPLMARLYRDVNGDGKYDFETEGDANGKSWIPQPDNKIPSIAQTFDVKCR